MKQQLSNILIAAMFCATGLYATGQFSDKVKDYATLHFDGGFKKIGVIGEQRTFSKTSVTIEGETEDTGSIDELIELLSRAPDDAPLTEKSEAIAGVSIKALVGLDWTGSEGNAQLTTETKTFLSTTEQPLNIKATISELEAMQRNVKNNHNQLALASLSFSERPQNSFLISKLLSNLTNR